MTDSDTIVRLRDVHFRRGSLVVFDGVDIDIPRGKITAIMGPSGTGKTTLLRLISGQLRPHHGTVEVEGQNVPKLKRRELYALRKNMGMLFQSGALLTDLSVFENIAFPLREHTDLPERLIYDLVLMKLEVVGLRGARHLMPAQLSGGMARRVALARAIALDPDMILYDEPFVGLDPIAMGIVVRLLRVINDALRVTSLAVTHDVNEVTSIADYCIVISDGQIMGKGTPQELRATDSAWVKQFMEGEADGPVPFHYPAGEYAAELLQDDTR